MSTLPTNPGFGLGRLHHVFARAERERIVTAVLDAGFRHFDLAPAYGEGLAERELGRILGSRRGQVTITTKFGIPFRAIGELPMPLFLALRAGGRAVGASLGARYDRRDFSPKVLTDSLHNSLRRLRTDYIDYQFVHEPMDLEQFRALGDTWAELERLQHQGKIKAFGVSGPARLLIDAEAQGSIPDPAVRMITLDEASLAQPEGWFTRREVFVFNVITHLRKTHPAGRIPHATVAAECARLMPHARPILASNNPDEIARVGAAFAALPPGSSSGQRTGAVS